MLCLYYMTVTEQSSEGKAVPESTHLAEDDRETTHILPDKTDMFLCYCTWIQVKQIFSSLTLLYLDTGKTDIFLAYATVPGYR